MVIALILLLVFALPAAAQDADSSAAQTTEREDTALEEGETGLVMEDAVARGGGSLRIAGDAFALSGALELRALSLEYLLAREPGEPRTVDDAYARLAYRRGGWTLALGRVQAEAGAGLVLGAPRAGPRTPGGITRPPGLAGLTSTPARAASGFTGAWLERRAGLLRAGLLLARTRRDARLVGEALLPLAGVRHRDARGDSARGALSEDAAALAFSAGPAWLVLAHAQASPFRVPPAGATAAEQRAARIVERTSALEAGFSFRPAPAAEGEAALALDAHGRARTAFTLELSPPRTRTRAELTFESEASGFVPLRARHEHRPHSHAGLLVRGPAWRLEGHAVERRAFEPARLWAAFRLSGPRGAWAELRRDADPVRTIVALALPVARGVVLAPEWRWDRQGLARETWRARAEGRLPRGLVGRVELRLAGARTSVSWLDAEVPGGAWAGSGTAAERSRLELARPGAVAPSVSWVRTRTASGTRSEVRLAVTWSTGR